MSVIAKNAELDGCEQENEYIIGIVNLFSLQEFNQGRSRVEFIIPQSFH